MLTVQWQDKSCQESPVEKMLSQGFLESERKAFSIINLIMEYSKNINLLASQYFQLIQAKGLHHEKMLFIINMVTKIYHQLYEFLYKLTQGLNVSHMLYWLGSQAVRDSYCNTSGRDLKARDVQNRNILSSLDLIGQHSIVRTVCEVNGEILKTKVM